MLGTVHAQGITTCGPNLLCVAAKATSECPCGYNGDPARECVCSESTITRYQKKNSGPLLDRIDIHMDVPRVEYEKLSDTRSGEASSVIRKRVEAARLRQADRFDGSGMRTNADMGAKEVQRFCELDGAGDTLMRAAMRQLQLSARSYHRILKLSRTIADLAGCGRIESHYLAEALQYRLKLVA